MDGGQREAYSAQQCVYYNSPIGVGCLSIDTCSDAAKLYRLVYGFFLRLKDTLVLNHEISNEICSGNSYHIIYNVDCYFNGK